MLFTNRVLDLFPLELAGALRNCRSDTQEVVEEIRCRVDRPPLLLTQDSEYAVSCRAVRAGDLEYLLERASGASVHTVADELRQGFLRPLRQRLLQGWTGCGRQADRVHRRSHPA